jgi:hypothetical protein
MGAYLLVLCGLTSAMAVMGGRRRGMALSALRGALGRTLECVGLAVVMLAANVMVGMVVVLGLRAATGHFVSLYPNADLTLLVLSLVQALVLQAWWFRPSPE